MGVRQPRSLTTLLISTPLFSPWSNFILTRWSMYSLLISLFSRHLWSLWFALNWFRLQAQILSSSLWSNHTVLNLCPSAVWYYSQRHNSGPIIFSYSKSKLIFSRHVLSFLFKPSSKHPRWHLELWGRNLTRAIWRTC